jgi:hypothetical protein
MTQQNIQGAAPTQGGGQSPATQEPKYRFEGGRVFNRASGEVIPLDEPVMVFRARDRHAVTAILAYVECCRDPQHKRIVFERAAQFETFAREHPERMKEPDTDLSAAPLPPAPDPAPGVTGEELDRLEALEKGMTPAPWSVGALSAGIRHLQRNTTVMEDAQDYAKEPDKSANLPGRYDGEALAQLRNALPALIRAARSHNTALSEAVGALEEIHKLSDPDCKYPALRLDIIRCKAFNALAEVGDATLSRLKSSTGGGE